MSPHSGRKHGRPTYLSEGGIPIVIISCKPRIIKQIPRKIYMYHLHALKIDLMKWSDEFKPRDTSVNTVNEMFQEFQTVLESAINSHVSQKDLHALKIDLMKWSDEFKLRDTSVNTVNEMFQEFQTVLESAMNSHIPTKIISKRNQTPCVVNVLIITMPVNGNVTLLWCHLTDKSNVTF